MTEINYRELLPRYVVSGKPVDYQDRAAQKMAQINDPIKALERVKPPMRALVYDLPKVGETEKNTIYILQQEWMVMDGKWVRLG